MDGVFLSEQIIECLNELGVEYSISVAYERYPTPIKCYIDERKRWRRLCKGAKFFDKSIARDSWTMAPHQFLFVRDR